MSQDDDIVSFSPPPIDQERWMVSFADLLSLMLTFFVMIYAASALMKPEFEAISSSLRERLSSTGMIQQRPEKVERSVSRVSREIAVDIDYLYAVISTKMKAWPALKGVQISRLDDRVVITLPSDSFFAPGDAHLTTSAKSAVFLLGEILSSIGNNIEVNGHTDPSAITRKASLPSNWELSLARAASVAAALRSSGYAHPINTFGYSDSRYDELPETLPITERFALARRVDIAIRTTAARK